MNEEKIIEKNDKGIYFFNLDFHTINSKYIDLLIHPFGKAYVNNNQNLDYEEKIIELLQKDNPKIICTTKIDLEKTLKNINLYSKNKKIMLYESQFGNPLPSFEGYDYIQSLNYLFQKINEIFNFNQINISGAELSKENWGCVNFANSLFSNVYKTAINEKYCWKN